MKEQNQGYDQRASGLPQHVVVGEFTSAELLQPSGITDEATGSSLTNLRAIELLERAFHGSQGVFLESSVQLSPEARGSNTRLTRSASRGLGPRGDYMYAVVSRRPPATQ